MNTAIVLFGDVALDALHLIFIGLLICFGAVSVWLFQERKRLSGIDARREALAIKCEELDTQNDDLSRDAAILKVRLEDQLSSFERERLAFSTRLSEVEETRRTLQLRLEDAEKKLEASTVREEERARTFDEERKRLIELREEVQTKFSEIAQTALSKSQKLFLETANETLGKQKEAAEGNLKEMFSPLKEAIGKFENRVENLEKVRAEDKSAIFEQVKHISAQLIENRTVTNKLVNALSTPKGGGSWGEESLKNALELAGVSEHCDFRQQSTDDDGKRPDVVIKMPGGREIVIDSKFSWTDYRQAAEEADEQKRDLYLSEHARKMRDHVRGLASKEYWKDIEHRVDFVAMWVPNEGLYSVALQYDRGLFDFAARNRVLIVTPSTLIALAKAVAYGWRQEEASKNALEAAAIGRELHKRLKTLADHVEKVGKHLGQSVTAYNKMTGSFDRMVLSQARKFEDLQLNESGTELPKPELLDSMPNNSGQALLPMEEDPTE